MNRHLNDGQLRATLDGELEPGALHHLESCPECQRRQHAMQILVEESARKLAFLKPAIEEAIPSAQAGLKRFRDRKLTQKENSMLKKLFASPLIRYGIPAVLALTLIVSIPATRALAEQFLNLFRVEQVAVVPVDFTGMQELAGGTLGTQITELISNSVTMTQKSGDPVKVADETEASQMAGFTVRLPQSVSSSSLNVLGASSFEMTVDRAKAQALIDEAGRSDLILPDSIDGAVISVSIPSSVMAGYGTCPNPSEADSDRTGSMGRNYPDCIMLSEIPSPIVSAPPEVDVAQLAQIGLEFAGMTSDQAAAFVETVDWTSTLVVPIPKNAATYEQVAVDGVTGTLIQRPSDDMPQFVLLWVKDGIVYSIGGLGTNSQQAIDMANSIP
jgi:hypothetical protein